MEPWAYLRDVLILLPTWPPECAIEFAPKALPMAPRLRGQRSCAAPWHS
ncbi:hypothetical protein AB3662_34355 [Sorangium cellulosum]